MDSFFQNMHLHNVDMNSEPIIVLKNVSKTYTLYKNDSERFRALFKNPRSSQPTRLSTTFLSKSARARLSALWATTAVVNPRC